MKEVRASSFFLEQKIFIGFTPEDNTSNISSISNYIFSLKLDRLYVTVINLITFLSFMASDGNLALAWFEKHVIIINLILKIFYNKFVTFSATPLPVTLVRPGSFAPVRPCHCKARKTWS